MTTNRIILLTIGTGVLLGWLVFKFENWRGGAPGPRECEVVCGAPAITGNIIDARSAVQRLEDVAIRNKMSMWVHSRDAMDRSCSVSAETGPSDDTHGVRRSATTCEAAATEVLKALEARNVR